MVALARRAEALGFSAVWVADEGFGQDPYVALTAIAAETRTIRLGTGITNPYTRHPAVTAVAIATLDAYAGGRAFLGLGAGGVLALAAIDVARSHLITRCRETITICRALWRNETVTFNGRTFRLTNARLNFTARPIEIWIGARGPNMLRMAGELADGVLINGIPHFDLDRVVRLIREGAVSAGRRVRLAYGVYLIPDRATLESIRPYFTFRLVDSPPEVRRRLGVSDDQVETLRAEITSHGLRTSARHVTDEILEQFVFLGNGPGTKQRLGEVISRHGFDQLALFLPSLETAEAAMTDAADIARHF